MAKNNIEIEKLPDPVEALRQKNLEGLQRLIPAGRSVVFFDYAVFRNVGDLLISKGVEEFFRINKNVVVDQFCMQNHGASLCRNFPAETILVFQGGGNFGDLFPRHSQIRKKILLSHPDNQAVILPQTLFYRSKSTLALDAEEFAGLKNLKFCLRDQTSFDVARTWFKNELFLLPDTAHFMQDKFGTAFPKKSVLNFLREDQSDYSVNGLHGLPDDRSSLMDWPKFLTPFEVAGIRRFQQLHQWDGRYWHSRIPYNIWKIFRGRILNRAAKLFLGSGEVVTNRLHGLIFSIICRRKTTILETGYGKVSAYYETWLRDFDTISLRNADVHDRGMAVMKKDT